MSRMPPGGQVAIFGPHPLLSITIEIHDDNGDDLHLWRDSAASAGWS